MLEKIIIVSPKSDIVSAFHRAFTDQDAELFDMVEVYQDSIENFDADAIVSPANSFGNMDGGVDAVITDLIGDESVKRLYREIIENEDLHGELPVGSALTISCTDKSKFKYLISAPTMRVPENVVHTTNAYVAFRAALIQVKKNPEIKSILVPTFCTGWGGMSGTQSAVQMKLAFEQIMNVSRIPSFEMIRNVHAAMRKTY